MASYSFEKAVNPDRLLLEIIGAGLAPLYIDTMDGTVIVWFALELSEEDQTALGDTITAHNNETNYDIAGRGLANAQVFGKSLIDQFRIEAITGGVIASGKSRALGLYTHNLSHFLSAGSLTAAVQELDILIADISLEKLALNPFITDTILNTYRSLIVDYLA